MDDASRDFRVASESGWRKYSRWSSLPLTGGRSLCAGQQACITSCTESSRPHHPRTRLDGRIDFRYPLRNCYLAMIRGIPMAVRGDVCDRSIWILF